MLPLPIFTFIYVLGYVRLRKFEECPAGIAIEHLDRAISLHTKILHDNCSNVNINEKYIKVKITSNIAVIN